MIRLEMKNCNMILTEKLQKYEHYHLVKLIKNELLTCKEVPPPDQSRVVE